MILIVLAAVSINMIIGDNGIITQAQRATLETNHANVKDRMQMKASEYQLAVTIDKLEKTFESYLKNDGIIDEENVVDVETLIGTSQTYGMGNGDTDIYYLSKNSNTTYTLKYVDKNGNEEDILIMNIANLTGDIIIDFETAQKHPDQVNSNDIGIAEDGTIVNLDLWYYVRKYSGTYALGIESGSTHEEGYIGNIVDGKIIGKVPMYIKEVGDTEFSLVTDLEGTFSGITELVEAPEIPSSIEDMTYAFYGCTKLTKISKIPDKVYYMNRTFENCTNLVTPPKIPDSVKTLWETFCNCPNLTGTLEINASSLDDYFMCLSDAATNEGCNLILTGTCPQLEEIYNTRSSNSKITLAQ